MTFALAMRTNHALFVAILLPLGFTAGFIGIAGYKIQQIHWDTFFVMRKDTIFRHNSG
jgi:hypothetical protein